MNTRRCRTIRWLFPNQVTRSRRQARTFSPLNSVPLPFCLYSFLLILSADRTQIPISRQLFPNRCFYFRFLLPCIDITLGRDCVAPHQPVLCSLTLEQTFIYEFVSRRPIMSILTAAFFALLFLCESTQALWKGFNLGANLPSGACKTSGDWERDFRTLQSLPGSFRSVRLFASSDCNTLANAVPAAIATGTTILAGVWATNDVHFNAEKQALLAAIQQHGHDWILGVSVGSEDLYRGDTNAQALANQVNDVRGMISSVGAGSAPVGHVDTWTAWVRPENEVLIRASDFVATDGYPYFQDSAIEDSPNVFWKSVDDVRAVVNRVKPGTPVWIGETGSPVSGASRGAAVPSVDNAQRYWKAVACRAFGEVDTFWYILQDTTASPSFGVVDAQFNPIYDLSCP